MIRYRLKKDLNKGSKFMFVPMGTETIATKYGYVLETANGGSYYFTEDQLDKDEEYFELIKEEPKEVFTWDDEKALAFARFTNSESTTFQGRYADLKEFKTKQSKRLFLPKERIEVSKVCPHMNLTKVYGKEIVYQFDTSTPISDDTFPLIKQAIEAVLNNDVPPSWVKDSKYVVSADCGKTSINFYTQEAMDKAREQTWEAARLTHPFAGMKYPTLESYLQTIKK